MGAYFGARLLHRISAVWLARAFAVMTVAVAVRMAFQGGGGIEGESLAATVDLLSGLGLTAVGLTAGALASMAIGGGILLVAALAILFSFPQHEAQATSLVVIVPTAVVATLVHARAALVDWRMVAPLGSGGVLGGFFGGRVALGLGEVLLRRMFAGFLVMVALRMVWTTARRTGDGRTSRPFRRAARRPGMPTNEGRPRS